ncbi:MAG: hypothetical protein N2316_06095 [Spirochaetes bacterium]|nr:hypothetical protein [Spirochaetota bacterium]
MIHRTQKKIAIFLIFFIILTCTHSPSFAQLPGWVLTKDRDGNSYYIDSRGKIWTSGVPEYKYKAVSSLGLDYYLNHGIQLIKNHYIAEGINILHSILALPQTNHTIYEAQTIASKEIKLLKKREGPRFLTHIKKYPILLYKINHEVCIQNQIIPYTIKIDAKTSILNSIQRAKHNYEYHGILAGLLFGENHFGDDKFDALLCIDSEQFKSILTSVDELILHWNIVLGQDVLQRRLLLKEKRRLINEILHEGEPRFTGFEGFFVNQRNGHIVRIIFSPALRNEYKEKCLLIIKNMSV